MCQADAFARAVLLTRAAKELKHALMIVRGDPTAIVTDLVCHVNGRRSAGDLGSTGYFNLSRLLLATILERIIDQIEKICSIAKGSLEIAGKSDTTMLAPCSDSR